GPLRTDRARLAAPVQAEAARDHVSVLVVAGEDDPVRMAVGRLPAFGDDDLAPVATAPTRMARWAGAWRSGDQDVAEPAVMEAVVSGVRFVVLPDQATADAMLAAVGDLATRTTGTTDGRPTVRLLPPSMPATVLAPGLANQARTGGAPPGKYGGDAVVAVPAVPPAVGAVIGPGGENRSLVLAAEGEDGWIATVDGRRTQVGRAWGHLVAVTLPAAEVEVRVERSDALRTLLLLVQLAVALFTAVTAVPPGDRAR
ncbi:MAG TPA: glycosyltransferase, partial [Pseudonocardiaceae bacterium]